MITADDTFVVFTIAPVKADVDKAKKEKKKPEEQPKGGLGVLNLATGQVFTAEPREELQGAGGVGQGRGVPARGAREEGRRRRPRGKPRSQARGQAGARRRAKKPKEKKKDPGTELIVRDLAAGTDSTIAEVVEYVWAKDG